MDIIALHKTLENGEKIEIDKQGNVRISWFNNENKYVFKNCGNLFSNKDDEIKGLKSKPFASPVKTQFGFTPYREFGKKEKKVKNTEYSSDIIVGLFEMSLNNPDNRILTGTFQDRNGKFITKFCNDMTGFYQNNKLKFVSFEGNRYINIERPENLELQWLDKSEVEKSLVK